MKRKGEGLDAYLHELNPFLVAIAPELPRIALTVSESSDPSVMTKLHQWLDEELVEYWFNVETANELQED